MLTGWAGETDSLVVLIYLRLLSREGEVIDIRDRAEVEKIRARVPAEQRAFVELRVQARLKWYSKTVNTLNFLRDVISGTVAGAGGLIAGLSATHPSSAHGLSWQNWVAIALGIVVGVLGAISPRLTRAQQVERYRRGMNRLRLEAWRFATKRDRYADAEDVHAAYLAFVDRVEEVESEAIATEADISGEH